MREETYGPYKLTDMGDTVHVRAEMLDCGKILGVAMCAATWFTVDKKWDDGGYALAKQVIDEIEKGVDPS